MACPEYRFFNQEGSQRLGASCMKQWRDDFPIFKHTQGKPLIYFDNAATSQKPQRVIDAITRFYTQQNSTIHRSIYEFGEQATTLYEKARATVAAFINADPTEII